MKLFLAAAALLLTPYCDVVPTVQAVFSDESNLRKFSIEGNFNNGDKIISKSVHNEDEEISIRVKFNNKEAGKKTVKGFAKIDTEIDSLQEVSFKATRSQMKELKDNPNILYAEEEQTLYALPNHYVQGHTRRKLEQTTPYGITMVEADQIPPLPANGMKKKVCVADTGYNNGHQDLPQLDQNDGFDNYGQLWSNDGHGHGTHCAGTIGALGDNDLGVVGVNKDDTTFDFFIGKALSDSGSGSGIGVMNAVRACQNAGADIISLSLGGGGYSQIDADDYAEIYEDGVLLIAAAGNAGDSGNHYPASYPALMSVAAVDSSKNRASFSVHNSQTEIAAPGVAVLSTLPDNEYAAWSGTSMACPHVAGVAALIWSHFPDCSNAQIRNVLIRSAWHENGTGQCDADFGAGIVKAKAAYDLLVAQGCEGASGLSGTDKRMIGGCAQDVDYVSPAPTLAPTFAPCDLSMDTLDLKIVTDNYGGETSWELKNDCSGSTIDSVPAQTYSSESTNHKQICLEKNQKYTFTINDSYGDGICCNYGTGSYEGKLNGDVVFEGGDFDDSESKPFGTCGGTVDPTPVPTPSPTTSVPTPSPTTSVPTPSPVTPVPTPSPVTPVPTISPSTSPTTSPVTPVPTPSPTDVQTPNPTPVSTTPPTGPTGRVPLEVKLETDNWGDETSFVLTDKDGKQATVSAGLLNDSTMYVYNFMVSGGDGCHSFVVNDNMGDGILYGSIEVYHNETLVAEYSGGTHWFTWTATFGFGCDGGRSNVTSINPVPIRQAPDENNEAQ